ncbi:endoribonuclease L-PSP [Podospora fimiseda]|uniref:Endoribonuclease L-PSP n=1 Tax=Podospora fimiseda TaxID=252190 RepID=A0AAN6YRC2_9PEZI|nr:endoribonuclease L-PSP [Podospora fimiseda]
MKFFTYPGFTEGLSTHSHYSQSLRLNNKIHTSGQGGWNQSTGQIPTSIKEEINQAFTNVETVLKSAGGKGWTEVYKVNLYYTKEIATEEGISVLGEIMKKFCGEQHRPLLTAVEVAGLALQGMRIEVEVSALVEGEE